MKILLTGANGTVGQLLNLHLAPWHTVTALQGSRDLDLLDQPWAPTTLMGVIVL